MATIKPCSEKEFPELLNDTRLTLSHIDSGCLVYRMQGHMHIIIKDTQSMVSSFENTSSVKLTFSPILKSEFPSTHMELVLRNQQNLSRKYEYFFMAESETDCKVLRDLRETNHLKLHLYDNDNIISFNMELDEKEQESIRQAYGEISHLLTKRTL